MKKLRSLSTSFQGWQHYHHRIHCYRFKIETGFPIFDIALLKLVNPVDVSHTIKICPASRQVDFKFHLVSFGSTSKESSEQSMDIDIPTELQRVSFYGSHFRYANIWNLETCPEYNVCAAPAIPGTLLTFGDGGSPLYKVDCIFKSECLMGLASYSQVDSSAVILGREKEFGNSGIFFANVPYFIPWIQITIFMNSWWKLKRIMILIAIFIATV